MGNANGKIPLAFERPFLLCVIDNARVIWYNIFIIYCVAISILYKSASLGYAGYSAVGKQRTL